MKSLPIHLNRLDKALRAQGVVFKRHQLLETCAAAFGFHNSNEATAAAKKGALNPPAAPATGRFELGDGQNLIVLLDPVANAPFAVDESFLEQQDAGTGNLFGVSPYGHLLDVTSAVGTELQTIANTLGSVVSGREFEFKIHTASIDHKHGTATFSSPTKEGVEADVEAWCEQYWEEVAHRFPEGHKLEGAELIGAYFEAHDQEFLTYGDTAIHLSARDILAAIGQAPQRDLPASRPPVPVSAIAADPVDPWADHPVYGSEDWRYEVGNGDTRQSYAEWVSAKIEEAGEADHPPIQSWSQDYPDGHDGPLCLTNACCEPVDGGPELFSRHGLKWSVDANGTFYPLTKDEARYIGEDSITMPNGFHAELGYSFFYQGAKFVGASVEVAFNPESKDSRDKTLAEVKAYASHIEKAVKAADGHVLVTEDDVMGDRHTIHALIPFDRVPKIAIDFDDWKIQIARILMPADGPRVIAHFQPQAWVKDYAIDVDASGETEWDITAEIIAMDPEKAQDIKDDSDESDAFTGSKSAPAFVRDWSGPYHVSVADQIEAYFEQIKNR